MAAVADRRVAAVRRPSVACSGCRRRAVFGPCQPVGRARRSPTPATRSFRGRGRSLRRPKKRPGSLAPSAEASCRREAGARAGRRVGVLAVRRLSVCGVGPSAFGVARPAERCSGPDVNPFHAST